MRPPVLRLHDEIIVDNFAGGGGASVGIEWALGRSPDIAVNHDPEAVAMHQANHPTTKHIHGDVWDVNPRRVCGGRRVGLAWFSPDCTFHSKARGGKPFRDRNAARKRRGLAWVVVRWAREVRPRIIILENVEEFEDWGPLDEDGKPDPERRGLTFRVWLGKLKAAGYQVEMRQLRAHDFGAPTIRRRLFIIARCDGQPIVWPEPTHGPGRPNPHRVAAECIQWDLPCPSIFGRVRPLADKTLRRIARGVQRFVVDDGRPFIAPHSLDHGLVVPTLIQQSWGERPGQAPRVPGLGKPLGTVVAGGIKHALVAAFLAKHNGGHEATGTKLAEPIHTITTQDHHALVASHMLKLRGTCAHGQTMGAPAPTITANGTHLGEVRSFLIKYYRTSVDKQLSVPFDTLTTKDRFGLVMVRGEPYVVADIGMRMLAPRELFRAQGFPPEYIIAPIVDGKPLSKTAQIHMCGNSVCPPIAAAIVRANVLQSREVAA